MEKFDVIIGMEIHTELKTKSKMFCSCPLRHSDGEASNNNSEGLEPNTAACPICMGHPGTLPVANQQAVEWTILTGLALNCQINKLSKFDRKNYFYPDLPKGYQISQYDLPLAYDGYLDIDGDKIAVTRIHLEEDTGKLSHPNGKNYSLVDYNRSSTPLMELVTEPVIKNGEMAKKFCQTYQQILRYLKISDADMEKGQMRCEANISVQEKGKWKYNGDCKITPVDDYKLNPKVEVKNINSFKAIEKAINYEINRQIKALEDGEKLIQETRGWDENKSITFSQRKKETSADYRYFPEPDIPPLSISQEWIDKIKAKLIELPPAKKTRFIEEYNFKDSDADLLVSDHDLSCYTEDVISELRAWVDSTGDDWERQKHKLAKIAANWLIHELFKHLKNDNKSINDIKITPENFAELVALVYQNKINSSAGQKIMEIMYQKGGDPTNIMADQSLEQNDNEEELENAIKEVIDKNPQQVAQFKAGKDNVIQFLVGQVMAHTQGKANPKIVIEILKKLISK